MAKNRPASGTPGDSLSIPDGLPSLLPGPDCPLPDGPLPQHPTGNPLLDALLTFGTEEGMSSQPSGDEAINFAAMAEEVADRRSRDTIDRLIVEVDRQRRQVEVVMPSLSYDEFDRRCQALRHLRDRLFKLREDCFQAAESIAKEIESGELTPEGRPKLPGVDNPFDVLQSLSPSEIKVIVRRYVDGNNDDDPPRNSGEEKTNHLFVSEWKKILEDKGMPHSSSSWQRFCREFGGERHPQSKHRVRFRISELKRAGVTISAELLPDSDESP